MMSIWGKKEVSVMCLKKLREGKDWYMIVIISEIVWRLNIMYLI